MGLELSIKILGVAAPVIVAIFGVVIARSNRRYKLEEAEACLKALATAEPHIFDSFDLSRLAEARAALATQVIDLTRRGTKLGVNDSLRAFRLQPWYYRSLVPPNTAGRPGAFYILVLHYYGIALVCVTLTLAALKIEDSPPLTWLVAASLFGVEWFCRREFWKRVRKESPQVFQ